MNERKTFKLNVTIEVDVNAKDIDTAKELVFENPPRISLQGSDVVDGYYRIKSNQIVKIEER